MVGNEEEREYSVGAGAPEGRAAGWRRISWGAIFAGTFIAVALFLTLQILGAGIGLSTINLTHRGASNAEGLGIGALVWWFVMGLISLFVGGWVAGRLGWRANVIDRILHGLTVWSFFYIVMFWLAVTALGALVGGGISLLGSSISAAGQAVGTPQGQQTIQRTLEGWGLSSEKVQQEVTRALGAGASQQNQQNPQANQDLATAVNNYLNSPRTPQDRQQLAQTITQTTGMNQAQANRMIANIERTAQQARETGQQAANITGWTFIGLAIAMLIGAVVAMLGSLAVPAPKIYTPPHEREHAGAGERAYAATR